MTDHQLFAKVLGFLKQTIVYSNEEMARLDELKNLVRDRLAQPVHASDMSEKHGDFLTNDRHEFFCPRCGHCCKEWVGLTNEEVHDAFNFVEFIKQISFDRDRPEWCENFAAYIEAKLKEKNS